MGWEKRIHIRASLLLFLLFITLSVGPCKSTSSKTTVVSSKLQKTRLNASLPPKRKHRRSSASALIVKNGGGPPSSSSVGSKAPPSMYWAVLHNWLYTISLGFNLLNIKYLIRSIVDGENYSSQIPSPKAIALSGKVESVDKILTFAGIGFLSALSDKYGRKPLMAWSAIGFAITNLIQARTKSSIAMLYLADIVDGCTSCMLPLCQAYVTDVSSPSNRAANLGVFQGLSVGGAFIIGFPIGGLLGARLGPRTPLLIAAFLQLLNAVIILFLTPESITPDKTAKINLTEANPIGGLVRLFCRAPLLRIASLTYLLTALARGSLDAQFTNYADIRFGWTQAQSGPVLVLVGLMLAIAPRLLVPLLGLRRSILYGLLIWTVGLVGTGLAPTPMGFVAGIFVVSIGCVAVPAVQALIANLAAEGERGALLGALGSLNELTAAISSTMYASLLAYFTSDNSPVNIPGGHFMVGAGFLLIAWSIAVPKFFAYRNEKAFSFPKEGIDMD